MQNFNPLELGFVQDHSEIADNSYAITAIITERYNLIIGNYLFTINKLNNFRHQWHVSGQKIIGFAGAITLAYLNVGQPKIDLIKELDRVTIIDTYPPRTEVIEILNKYLIPFAREYYIQQYLLS